MSAREGYRYLLRSVAAGDGSRPLSTPLTRYYTAEGTPPGRWLGSGVAALGGGRLREGDEVSEAQLQLLVGMGRDPLSGDPLGRAYPAYASRAERIENRTKALGSNLSDGEREAAVAQIVAEEAAVPSRRAVAGYDFTFSVPKSASVLWAVADAGMQEMIAAAHHAAVADVVAYMEREVAATRAGATGRGGAVAQIDVTGLIAAAFDHFDSRAGDPHLHTHVVISNKAKTVLDGRWRSLDSRPMHAATVALSELHEAVFADHLTRALGVQWERRDRGRDRNPAWAITAVPEQLVGEFSVRSRHIEVEKDRLIAEYAARHGRQPSATTVIKLRAQATLTTRPEKEVRSLADLTAQWRQRASRILGSDATSWALGVAKSGAPLLLRADDVPLDAIALLGASVVEAVGEKRSTWRRWNLTAEAARQTMDYRFATIEDREAVLGLVVDAAEAASLRLTPPELATSPAVFQRPDGTSLFRPKHSTVFSSEALLAAEDRLLERSRTTTGPAVAMATVERITAGPDRQGRMLGDDQAVALAKVAVSGRIVDVLLGPAGAGKTTAMSALWRVWEAEHGPGSVVGLAPSAAAAQVLADDLGIETENTAKWWDTHKRTGQSFRKGHLVILDEASLAGTLSLDRITGLAAEAGAKVLLVGDHAQLQSVDAGGAFSLLVHDRDDAPELVDVRRFANEWEKAASLGLRHGRTEVIDTYIENGRVLDGETGAMTDAAYRAWRADQLAGRGTVLVADSAEAVTALNERARTDLILDGTVRGARDVEMHDGTRAAAGDTVITRRNDRRLRAGRGWVRNGDRWTVTAVHDDGSLTLRRTGTRHGATTLLPAAYAAEHLELAYAVTSYRAQGITVDTSHVLVDASMTRENLYVAMTRGRNSNTLYVAVDQPDTAHEGPHPGDSTEATGRSILHGVLQHVGAEPSAHETINAEQEQWGSIAQLAAEYETLAAAAQHDRWANLIRSSGLTPGQADEAIASGGFGPLTAGMRRAEANHHDVEALFPRLVQAHGFNDADDVAAVLHHRLAVATARPAGSGRTRNAPRLIAGLIPEALGPMAPEMRQALDERRDLIEARADAFLDQALNDGGSWAAALGTPPRDERTMVNWRRLARTVAAYRDRYGITAPTPLGAPAENAAQRTDAARARAALDRATALSPSHPAPESTHRPSQQRSGLGL
ncbi:relaxase domain-containing protein [Sinomonas sp. 5-5]|uniref:Relaxase domain-containing protein n=1 Tax=Sinomonas terrae TaxID=2908838 RepID=A0ABS9U1U6_9MICC|nr:MobF family relaxase [Sinomonas terrae]MCH6470673.1 relaxase domain-containing protein [Sinomonas terrae]